MGRRWGRMAAVAALTLGACGGDDTPTDGRVEVVTAFYPLEELAREIGGDRVTVTDLTGPGRSPHELELDPKQVRLIEEADLALYLGRGFQPQVEAAVAKSSRSLDLLEVVELLPVDAQLEGTVGEVDGEVLEGDVDPHVWLDPSRMMTMAEAVRDELIATDPGGADTYRANATTYLASLSGLDGAYRAALGTCDSRVVVTSHRAFGYLADTYGLRQLPIAGVSPDAEPDPRTLEAIAAEARREGVRTIFLETIAPPDLARTVAREIGAELDLLDPIEGFDAEQRAAGATYAGVMRENLTRLVEGLGCRS